jgi:hypothetical protein
MYCRASDLIDSGRQNLVVVEPPGAYHQIVVRSGRYDLESQGAASRAKVRLAGEGRKPKSQGLLDLPFSSSAVICVNCVSSAALRSEIAQ